MSRDANGNYTLPAGNPVVTETLITSVWANTTMPDLGTEMTDSLSRSGKGNMLAPLRIVDSALPTPGLAFANEPTSGLLRSGAGDVRMRVLGTDVLRWTQTQIQALVPLDINNVSVTNVNIDSGTIDGTVIGGATPAAGTFTSVNSSGAIEITGNTFFIAANDYGLLGRQSGGGTRLVAKLNTSNQAEFGESAIQTVLASPTIITSLPTTNPAIAGALWNNSGVVNVSSG